MKRFIVKLFIFLIIILLVDIIIGVHLQVLPGFEVDNRLEKVLEGEINSDVIIIGSSIGARGILAERIEDNTDYSAYNLAYPGSDITFHEFILSTYIKYNKWPKKVILTVDETLLKEDRSLKFRLDKCYPLLKYDYISETVAKKENKNMFLARYSHLYMLNKSNIKYKKQTFIGLDTIGPRGSMPLTFQKDTFQKLYKDNYTYTASGELANKKRAFEHIVMLCENNGVDLILSIPPKYAVLNSSFVKRIKQLYNGPLITISSQDSRFKTPMLFSDAVHLNKQGAELYTDYIIHYLSTGD